MATGFYCTKCGTRVPIDTIEQGCPNCGSFNIIELTNEDLFDYDEEEEENDVN